VKKSILVLVILVLLLALLPAGVAQAKKPLHCDLYYEWFGASDPDFGDRFVTWKGTISGDIEGTIVWFPGLEPMVFTGQASHYDGSWEIWEEAGGNMLLAGYGYGSSTARHGKNSNWRTNDVITDAGVGYEDWIGRHVHQSGNFEWADITIGLPSHGWGIFRAN
jgi:hypothetical protein